MFNFKLDCVAAISKHIVRPNREVKDNFTEEKTENLDGSYLRNNLNFEGTQIKRKKEDERRKRKLRFKSPVCI